MIVKDDNHPHGQLKLGIVKEVMNGRESLTFDYIHCLYRATLTF